MRLLTIEHLFGIIDSILPRDSMWSLGCPCKTTAVPIN